MPALPSTRIPAPTALAATAFAAIAFSLAACTPTESTSVAFSQEPPPVAATVTVSGEAPFPTWHQGFNHGTAGWYGAETPGDLGWCGSIESVTRNHENGGPPPSAGRGYATITAGPCNAFWTGLGVPGGAPYAPGPERSLYSEVWPAAGYVTELDLWLDPAWADEYTGTFVPEILVQYAATIFPLDPDADPFHTGPHYFVTVGAAPSGDALQVLGHTVTEAAWYTVGFVFRDEDGHVRGDAELRGRRGPRLAIQEDIPPVELLGPTAVPFTRPLRTAEYGSGHVWFFDVAPGLVLPIDEHRVR